MGLMTESWGDRELARVIRSKQDVFGPPLEKLFRHIFEKEQDMDMQHNDDGSTTVKANVGKDFKFFSDHKRAQMLAAASLFDEQIRYIAAEVFESFLEEDEDDDLPDDDYAELATEFAGLVLKLVARTVSEIVGPLIDQMKAEIPSGNGVVTIGWQEDSSDE